MMLSSVCFPRIYYRKKIKMLELETFFVLVNAVLYKHPTRFCLYEYSPKKLAILRLKVFLRKSLNFRTKLENFWTLIFLKMSWLAAWFIFELIGVWVAPALSEPQAFKNISKQMMIDQTLIFCHIFSKKFTSFNFWCSAWLAKVEVEVVPFYRFQLRLPWKFAASTSTSTSLTVTFQER